MSDFIEKIFVANTQHLPDNECNIELLNLSYRLENHVMKRDYGYFIHVGVASEHVRASMFIQRFTHFLSLLENARVKGAEWLLLDRDGHIHKNIPTFRW